MADLFSTGFRSLEATLIAREKVQGSISSNIANADTPNFAADTRSFEDFLAAEMSGSTPGQLHTTQPGHIRDSGSEALTTSPFHQATGQRMDGNSVDMQKEMARMAENQLMHDLSSRLIKGKISGLLNAIKEGNR